MISKVHNSIFIEADSVRYIQTEIEKNRRIKTYFSVNDRTPNTDGYFEILNEQNMPIKRFVVQIKSRKPKKSKDGRYAFTVDTAFFQFVLENIDDNPAIYFIFNNETRQIFYKYLDLKYLLSLHIQNKKYITIHLDETDVLKEENLYHFCMSVHRLITFNVTESIQQHIIEDTTNRYCDISIGTPKRFKPLKVDEVDAARLHVPIYVINNYSRINLLDIGGSSVLFLLESVLTGQKAVLKVSKGSNSDRQYLINEARVLNKIKHPSIPKAFSFFSEYNSCSLLMEYIEGETLDNLNQYDVFDLSDYLTIFVRICDVITYIHDKGFLHGDIKPSNIILGESYQVNLIDFGLAENINLANQEIPLAGTRLYTAPEVLNLNNKTIASEIYGLGATFLSSILKINLHRKTFNDSTSNLYRKISNDSTCMLDIHADDHSGLQRLLTEKSDEFGYGEKVLKTALAENPNMRYGNVKELQEQLLLWQKEEILSPSELNINLNRRKEQFFSKLRKEYHNDIDALWQYPENMSWLNDVHRTFDEYSASDDFIQSLSKQNSLPIPSVFPTEMIDNAPIREDNA